MIALVFAVIAFVAEALSESDFEFGVWEPEFVETYGTSLSGSLLVLQQFVPLLLFYFY